MQVARRTAESHHLQHPTSHPRVPAPANNGPSSHFRGVSLLKRTGRWHAQINFEGRQVHLGFFPAEEDAAAAYDRAAIIKWCATVGGAPEPLHSPQLNFGVQTYTKELPALGRLTPAWLLGALGEERSRRDVMAALAHGFDPESVSMPTITPIAIDSSIKRTWTPPEDTIVTALAVPVTPPAPHAPAFATVKKPLARQKRRKLAVPLHGPCM